MGQGGRGWQKFLEELAVGTQAGVSSGAAQGHTATIESVAGSHNCKRPLEAFAEYLEERTFLQEKLCFWEEEVFELCDRENALRKQIKSLEVERALRKELDEAT